MKTARDILVIDDEPVVVQGVARICRSEGLTVDTAPNGRTGLERLNQTSYRLILCDIMMGDLDGFEFLAEAQRRGERAPVVMTTGNSTVQNAVRSLQCGAIDYVAKPFTADELMAVMHRGLNYAALRADGVSPPPAGRTCPPHYHWLGYMSWAATEPVGTVLMGVDDLFVKTVQPIRSVELAAVGSLLIQGTACATMVSENGLAHLVLSPISGEIIEADTVAGSCPVLIEEEPYESGWLYRVLPSDLEYSLQNLFPRPEKPDAQPSPRKGESL